MHFSERLKLRADLLPVVANPSAPIAPYSKLKDRGKTPSRYNSEREIHGITDWTNVNADARDISRWSREPDYGICLQTRLVRALDIDVADPAHADQIEQAIRDTVPGVYFPKRWRANSGKRLLAFSCDGELHKRSFPVGTERIELLATGQQFVAVGTHPSGARYEWDGSLPEGFPVLSSDEVETVWSTLELLFATGDSFKASARERKGSASGEGDATDEVAQYLAEHGLCMDEGPAGQVYFECPWIAEHTADNGVTQTVYFPAATGGFDNGHFKCLHDHCAGRTDDEFLEAIGFNGDIEFRARDFPMLTSSGNLPSVPGLEDGGDIVTARPNSGRLPVVPPDTAPIFKRDAQSRILVTQDNVARAFDSPEFMTRKLRFDQFNMQPVWAWYDEPDGCEQWQAWSDVDNARSLRTLDRRGFKNTPGIEMVRRAVDDIARSRPVDIAMQWLLERRWDGVDRIETFLIDYLGAEDTPYVRAVSRYMWTAMAGRCLEPGIKADMAVILVTPEQGKGKTTMIESLVPNDEWFGELDLERDDADLGRLMKGKLVLELSELKGLASRELDSIKKFISARKDEWTPKFVEYSQEFKRRCFFIGTTNEEEFLADPTGERRWLPLYIKQANIAAIKRDLDLLWAEARERFKICGVEWQDAESLAVDEHYKFKASDPLEDTVRVWLWSKGLGDYRPAEQPYLTLEEVFEQGLKREFGRTTMAEQKRVGRIMRAIGYKNEQITVDGIRRRLWVKKEKENG